MMKTNKKIFVAGHQGMVGSAIIRALEKAGQGEVICAQREQLDLTRQKQVEDFFADHAIDEIYLAAAKVGGIHANHSYPAEFIYQNLMIQCNIIHAAHECNIDKLLLLGSSCIYPGKAEQPMQENALLTGILEPTNEAYAIAKIAGIKLCESYQRQFGRDYRSLMPTNLYGPGDNFHLDNAHVIPALMHRFHQAKLNQDDQVIIWGSGKPKREFLYVDDLADACLHFMNLEKDKFQQNIASNLSHINIGTGHDCSIAELAQLIKQVVGYSGKIEFDLSKPDGTERKLLDVKLAKTMGWQFQTDLISGLERTYQWFLQHETQLRC